MTATHLIGLPPIAGQKPLVQLVLTNGATVLVPLLRKASVASLRRSVEQTWRDYVGGEPPHVTVIKAGDAVGVCATPHGPRRTA